MTPLFSLILIILFIYLNLLYNVYSLRKRPCKYPLEVLSNPPKGKTVYITQSDGTKIKTVTAGSGPTIIFAHGYGASLYEWNLIADQLVSEGYSIIAFDQKGHCGSTIGSEGITSSSMASVYKSVLEYYDVKKGTLVGHSMGGFLSIVFMLSYPDVVRERLSSAIIMASFAGDVNRDNTQNKLQLPLITSGLIDLITRSKILGYPFTRALIGDEPDSALIEAFLQEFRKVNHKPLVPIMKAFSKENYYDQLNKIGIPCTIIAGTKDKTTPPFHANDMAINIPHARLVLVEGKGHLLNWESPESIVEEIRKVNIPKVLNKLDG